MQARACLASLACCAAVFLGFGGAIWSQLAIGWQWSAPDTAATAVATLVMSGAMLVLAVLALLAVAAGGAGRGERGSPAARRGAWPSRPRCSWPGWR